MKNEITVITDGPNPTVTILEGMALDPKYPNRIQITGNINAISSFLKKRNDGFDLQKVEQSKAVVEVDKENMTIALSLDPQNPFGTVITGVLELSPELKVFNINTNKTFNREELVKLIRFNRLAFDNKDEHDKVLKAYMAFQAKTAGEIGSASDTRGNKSSSFNKSVDSNIPAEFKLLIPIFKGQQPLIFRVEICLDVTDASARFWFESTELKELIETQRDIIFNEELKSCEQFVIINK